MKKLILGGVAIVVATILGAILAYLAIIWYVDRHPTAKASVASKYVSEQGLCNSGLDYSTSKPYWCKPSVLTVTNNYGGQAAVDDRAEPQQALGYKAYLLNSEFHIDN
jgi:hypothetical protein